MPASAAFNEDCMEVMRRYPDKYFDLAIVDPPYGGGGGATADTHTHTHTHTRAASPEAAQTTRDENGRASVECLTSTISANLANIGKTASTRSRWAKYNRQGGVFDNLNLHWDVAPPVEYFKELARVSKNQIIWGGNYFDLPPTRCFLIWRKTNIPLEGFSMACCEYAWTSFNANARMFECFSSGGSGREERFHPTQKPVALYRWILQHFAEPGFKILDTHLGSGSSRIAAYDAELDFVGCEIDEEYFARQEERFSAHTAQQSLFVGL